MPPKPLLELDIDEVRAVLHASGGNITTMGRRLGVPGKTWQRWLERHPAIRSEAHDLHERLMAEAAFDPDPLVVIGAVDQLNGNMAAVCKQFHVARSVLFAYCERHPEVKRAVNDVLEAQVDMAESSLYRAVLNGEAWAVTFFLKTRGKRRGYIERSDSLNINVDLTRLSVEQLERLAAGEHPANVLGTHEESTVVGPRAYADPVTGES